MKGKAGLAVAMIALAAVSAGCLSRGFKEVTGLRGGKGSFTVTREVAGGEAARPLGAYRCFKLERFSDAMGGRVPGALFIALQAAFEEALAEKKIANARSGKALLIRGRVVHYEAAGISGQMFGPLEEAVAQIEFVDAGTKKVLGTANVVGRTNSTTSQGIHTKAQGIARAIAAYIDKRYPKDQRIQD